MTIKLLLGIISISIIISLGFIVCAIPDKDIIYIDSDIDIGYDEKITEPEIDIYISINKNNGIYSLSVNEGECINKHSIQLNTIDYKITNISEGSEDTHIKDINIFTFSLHNSTKQKYADKEISFDLTLYGTGYIINKDVEK